MIRITTTRGADIGNVNLTIVRICDRAKLLNGGNSPRIVVYKPNFDLNVLLENRLRLNTIVQELNSFDSLPIWLTQYLPRIDIKFLHEIIKSIQIDTHDKTERAYTILEPLFGSKFSQEQTPLNEVTKKKPFIRQLSDFSHYLQF